MKYTETVEQLFREVKKGKDLVSLCLNFKYAYGSMSYKLVNKALQNTKYPVRSTTSFGINIPNSKGESLLDPEHKSTD